jgi:hypothetical protein
MKCLVLPICVIKNLFHSFYSKKTLVLVDVRYNRNFLKPLTNQFYLFLHLKSIVKWLEIWNKMNVIIFIKS